MEVTPTAISTLTEKWFPVKCKTVKTYLTARCAGLFEIPQIDQKGSDAPVQFLHRTARGFLYSDETWSKILRHTKDSVFNPNRGMLIGSILELALKNTAHLLKKDTLYSKAIDAILYAPQRAQIDMQGLYSLADTQIPKNNGSVPPQKMRCLNFVCWLFTFYSMWSRNTPPRVRFCPLSAACSPSIRLQRESWSGLCKSQGTQG